MADEAVVDVGVASVGASDVACEAATVRCATARNAGLATNEVAVGHSCVLLSIGTDERTAFGGEATAFSICNDDWQLNNPAHGPPSNHQIIQRRQGTAAIIV